MAVVEIIKETALYVTSTIIELLWIASYFERQYHGHLTTLHNMNSHSSIIYCRHHPLI